MPRPWDGWVPGVLSRKQLIKLHEDGYLVGLEFQEEEDIDHSSFDLHLDGTAYHLHHGSIKPWAADGKVNGFLEHLKKRELVVPLDSNDEGHFRLERKQTYLSLYVSDCICARRSLIKRYFMHRQLRRVLSGG